MAREASGLKSLSGVFRPHDVFVTCVFLLVTIGTVMVFSASAFHWSVGGDVFYFLRRQLAWLPIAVLGCLLFRQIDYRFFRRHYWQLSPSPSVSWGSSSSHRSGAM